ARSSQGRKPMLRGAMFAIAMVWAGSAHASDPYLAVLVTDYGYQGNCMVCHDRPEGGEGTVTMPFGQTVMIDLGLVGEGGPQLLRDVMEDERMLYADSDG